MNALLFEKKNFFFCLFSFDHLCHQISRELQGRGRGHFLVKNLKVHLSLTKNLNFDVRHGFRSWLALLLRCISQKVKDFFPLSFFSSLHKSLPFFPSCTKSKVLQMSFKLKQKRKDNKSYSFLLLGPIYRKCSCYFSKTKLCVREDAIEWPSMVSWASTGFWVWFPAASVPSRSLFYS